MTRRRSRHALCCSSSLSPRPVMMNMSALAPKRSWLRLPGPRVLDTELLYPPVFTLTQPQIARNLLLYRYLYPGRCTSQGAGER